MSYIQQIGNVIYVTIPGVPVKQFSKAHAAKAQDYCKTKCRQMGIAYSKPKEPILPAGLRIAMHMGVKTLFAEHRVGDKKFKTSFSLRKWTLDEAIQEAINWKYCIGGNHEQRRRL